MNTVLLLDHSFKLSCKIADTLFRSDINVFRVSSEEQCAMEANRLAPIGIIVATSDNSYNTQALCKTLLQNRKVPVVVISENHDEAEELAALQIGVSAFLDGGASCELIAARILLGLKIGLTANNGQQDGERRRLLSHDHLVLDIDAHNVKWRGQELDVTCKEMSLLAALIQRPGVVQSRSSLIDQAYADNIHVDERTIDSHMKRIRAKFRDIDPNFDGIQSVYGIGYRFRLRPKSATDMKQPAKTVLTPMGSRLDASRTPIRPDAYAALARLAS